MLENGQVPSGGSGMPYFSDGDIGDNRNDGDRDDQNWDDDNVVPGDPPPDGPWERRSFWVVALEAARREKSWVRVNRFYTAATAAQIASDIRSAHNRDTDTLRVRGILPGERWEARWGVSPECPPGNFVIWVRFLGPT